MTNKENDNEIRALLKATIAPVRDTEPRCDLWPQVLRKLDEHAVSRDLALMNNVPWFDWALAAVLGAVLVFFPGSIPALLYHL